MLGYILHRLSSRFTAGVTMRRPKRTKTEEKTLKNGLPEDGGKGRTEAGGRKERKATPKKETCIMQS